MPSPRKMLIEAAADAQEWPEPVRQPACGGVCPGYRLHRVVARGEHQATAESAAGTVDGPAAEEPDHQLVGKLVAETESRSGWAGRQSTARLTDRALALPGPASRWMRRPAAEPRRQRRTPGAGRAAEPAPGVARPRCRRPRARETARRWSAACHPRVRPRHPYGR